jgi:hypothetical protein
MTISFWRGLAGHYAACLSILAAPLLVFMDANYAVFSTETLILLACLALLASPFAILASVRFDLLRCAAYALPMALVVELRLDNFPLNEVGVCLAFTTALVVLWPVRRHLALILVSIFGVVNLATTGMALANRTEEPASLAEPPHRADLPAIVHIILDEQIGLDGLVNDVPGGEDVRTWLLALLESEGFAVFGRAYSPYDLTRDSIPSAFNFVAPEAPQSLYSGGGVDYALVENEYFRRAIGKGYSIRVYQSDFMEYCETPSVPVEYCHTYRHSRPSGDEWDEVDVFRRSLVLARMYGGSTLLLDAAWRTLDAAWSAVSGDASFPPSWQRRARGVGPISSMATLNKLIEDVGQGTRGTLYFAHLLLPHHSYIFDRDCRIRDPLFLWGTPVASMGWRRNDLYAEYHDQMRCTFKRLKALMDRMKAAAGLEDALIVLHGDHGSRIGPPTAVGFRNMASLTRHNYLDTFSTLFAVRDPRFAKGYHPRVAALPTLLREFADGPTAVGEARERDPFVYLRQVEGRRTVAWHRVPFTAFADFPTAQR